MSARLIAHTGHVGVDEDLLSAWEPASGFFLEREGAGMVGIGTALTIEVPAGPNQVRAASQLVAAALRDIAIEGEGPAPVAVGALPFDGSRPAALVVPRTTLIRRGDGSTWEVFVERESEASRTGPRPPRGRSVRRHPHSGDDAVAHLSVRSFPVPRDFVAAVTSARDRIRSGVLRKVVLARSLIVEASAPIDSVGLLRRLRDADPSCHVFGFAGLVGASPELLVRRRGAEARANPLAGSAPRRVGATADAQASRRLLASRKDREEHAFVVEAVQEALLPVSERLDVDSEPSLAWTSRLWHLSTQVRATLRAPVPDALALAALLHPTPAVCGTPKEAALEVIRELERIERGLYAGIVGWVDANGDGDWAIALRCAEVWGRTARLFAGAGIVADSDPEAELAETETKFRAVLSALGYRSRR